MKQFLCIAASLISCAAFAAAPTPIELLAFDQSMSVHVARSALDIDVLRAAIMPDQTALAKREWLLQWSNRPIPDTTFVSKIPLRLDYVGSRGVGESCETALTISSETDLQTQLGAAGTPKSILWLRIPPRKDQHLALSSVGSRIDTMLSTYKNCGEDFLAKSDDYTGLQALVAMPKGESDVFVRAENLGAAGELRLRAVLASIVSGTVTRRDNGSPIADATIAFFDLNSFYVGQISANQSGNYQFPYNNTSATSLFARTIPGNFGSSSAAYVDRAYNDIECDGDSTSNGLASCTPAVLTPIPVSPNTSVGNINFRLSVGARLSVRTIAATTGLVLSNINIVLYSANGVRVRSTSTDAAGRALMTGLRSGVVYKLVASSFEVNTQLYDGITCTDFNTCPLNAGTPIVLAEGQFRDVSMTLTRNGSSQQTTGVRLESNPPAAFVQADVILYYPNGLLAGRQFTNNGYLDINNYFPAGDYYLVGSGNTFRNGLYPGIVCTSDCRAELTSGQLIRLPLPNNTLLTLTLQRNPTISGLVTDTAGQPIADARIEIETASGQSVFDFVNTNSAGAYATSPLPPGSYKIRALSNFHLDVAYPNVPCSAPMAISNCVGAQPIALSNAVTGINFSLVPSARISGQIPNSPGSFNNWRVDALSNFAQDPALGVLQINSDGTYKLDDIAPGNYKFGVNSGAAFPQIFPGANCLFSANGGGFLPYAQCTPGVGQTFALAAGQSLPGINFSPKIRGLTGQVLRSDTGAPLVGVGIDIWQRQGGVTRVTTTATDAQGRFFTNQLSQGASTPYSITTDNGQGFVDEVYNNIACPLGSAYAGLCDPLLGTELDVSPWFIDPNTSPLIITLDPRASAGTIFKNGFE
jgi:hypothetical protein